MTKTGLQPLFGIGDSQSPLAVTAFFPLAVYYRTDIGYLFFFLFIHCLILFITIRRQRVAICNVPLTTGLSLTSAASFYQWRQDVTTQADQERRPH
jgi:hypothetical protein